MDTQSDSGKGLSPGLGDLLFAHVAMGSAFTTAQPISGLFDRIRHTGIDLFLNRPVSCPSDCHALLLFLSIFTH